MRQPRRAPLLVLAVLLAGPAALHAQVCPERVSIAKQREALAGQDDSQDPSGLPILVESERAEYSGRDESVFTGGVRVTRGAQTVESDRAVYDPLTGRIAVDGEVSFSQPGLKISGTDASWDSRTRTATVEEVTFDLPQTPARGHASSIEVVNEEQAELEDVRYTTCPQGDEDWWLRADSLELDTATEIGAMRRARLDFKGVPLIYAPYFTFPLSLARKSGLLIPELRQSDRTGTEFSIPWYWNIAPNYDMTITPRWMSKRGLMLMTENRYLTDSSAGQFDMEYLRRDERDPDKDDRRYNALIHTTRFANDWRLFADLKDVSDSRYFEDFGRGIGLTSQTHLQRLVQLGRADEVWRVGLRAENWRTIDLGIAREDRPYARLPAVSADGFWRSGLFGMDWGLRTELANFSRDEGVEGIRLWLQPEASLPVEGPGYFFVPSLSWRHVSYSLRSTEDDDEDHPTMSAPIVKLDTGLLFEREQSDSDYIQTLEPRLLYAYVPKRGQEDLPVFDTGEPDFNAVQLYRANRFIGADRLGDTNQISVGVTSRILESVTGREFLTATIGKAWYLDDREVVLPNETGDPDDNSPIVLELGMRLFRSWNADIGYQWSEEDRDTRLAEARVQYQPAPNRVLNLQYRYRPGLLEDAEISLGWPLSRRWSFVGHLEYSLRDETTIDRLVGLQYESCCWAARLATERHISRRDGSSDTSVLLQLEFKGLVGLGTQAGQTFERDILGYSLYE